MSAKIGVSAATSMASQAIGRLGTSVEQAGEMGRTWDDCSSRVDAVGSGAWDGLLNFNRGARQDFEEDFRRQMRDLGYA